jgi:hypothetical protein
MCEDTAPPAVECCADIAKLTAVLLSLWSMERPRGVCPFTDATLAGLSAILLTATRGADNLTPEESLMRARHGLAGLLGNIE